MQNSTITTSESQVAVNVQTNESRVKDFTFGENNQHHILQEDESKNVISSITVDDGLGITDTIITVAVPDHTVILTVSPSNTVSVTHNSVPVI